MKSRYHYILMVLFLYNSLFASNTSNVYASFLIDRLNHITIKEYSTNIDDVYVGLVNYPQWFVTLSTGLYNGLTMHNTIKGSESLYPTNVTQQRWMHTFNTSSRADIEVCKKRLLNWTNIPNLQLVMYSQAMIVCLSSNMLIIDNKTWYEKCWRKYHNSCKIIRSEEWI